MKEEDLINFILNTLFLTLWLGMFGTQIEVTPLIQKFKDPRGIILGAVLQTIFLPAWTSMLIAIFQTSSNIAIAFLVVGCSPGGTGSNIWCLVTQSDLALSAAMTTFSTFLCSGMMPLNLYLWGKLLEDSTSKIPIEQVVVPAFSVIIGTGIGMYLRHTRGYTEKTLKRIAKAATIFGIILWIYAIVKIYMDAKPTLNLEVGDYFLSLLMNGTTLLIGALVARKLGLTKPEAVSVGYEVSTQNLAIPLVIFYNSFSEDKTANMTTILFLFGMASLIMNVCYHFTMVKLKWTNHFVTLDRRPSWVSKSQLSNLGDGLEMVEEASHSK
jgi:predicted Na+-dependent transporter